MRDGAQRMSRDLRALARRSLAAARRRRAEALPSDTDLLLHIGLPKTGSTVLQYSVLARVRSKVFVHASGPQEHQALIRALAAYLRCDDAARPRQQTILDRCLAVVVQQHAQRLPGGTLIISNENLAMAPHDLWRGQVTPPAQIAERLGAWIRSLGLAADRARVVIGLRRQDQWLASRYAESAKVFEDFSQDDFERRMREMFDPVTGAGCEWLEYDRVLAMLRSQIGHDAVAPLSAELFRSQPIEALRKLERALGRADLVHAYTAARERGLETTRNVLAQRPDVWKLRGHDRELVLAEDVQELVTSWYAASNARLDGESPGTGLTVLGYR